MTKNVFGGDDLKGLQKWLGLVPSGRLARGTVYTFGLRLFAMALAYVLQFVFVRALGPKEFGDFMYANAWYLALLPLAGLGLHEAAVRFIPEYKQQGKDRNLEGYLRWAAMVTIIGSASICVVFVGVTWLFRVNMTDSLFYALVIVGCCIPIGAVGVFHSMSLRGVENFIAALAPQQVLQPLVIMISLFVIIAWGQVPLNAPVAAICFGLGVCVFSMVSFGLSRKTFKSVLLAGRPDYRRAEWINTGSHFLGLAVVSLTTRSGQLLLGILGDTTQVGIYATALQLRMLGEFVFVSMDIVIGPRVAVYHAEGNRERLQTLLRISSVGSFLFALVIGAVLLWFGRPILGVFDPTFQAGYGALVMLVVGLLWHTATGPAGRVLTMTGHHAVATKLWTIAVVGEIGLNLVLVPHFGMLGTAVANLCGIIVWKVTAIQAVSRLLSLDTTLRSIVKRRS